MKESADLNIKSINVQSEEERENRLEIMNRVSGKLIRRSNICAICVPSEATEIVAEKGSKDIEAKKFPKFGEHINLSFKSSVNPKQDKYI